jgi:hypothetical protein
MELDEPQSPTAEQVQQLIEAGQLGENRQNLADAERLLDDALKRRLAAPLRRRMQVSRALIRGRGHRLAAQASVGDVVTRRLHLSEAMTALHTDAPPPRLALLGDSEAGLSVARQWDAEKALIEALVEEEDKRLGDKEAHVMDPLLPDEAVTRTTLEQEQRRAMLMARIDDLDLDQQMAVLERIADAAEAHPDQKPEDLVANALTASSSSS